MDRDAVEALGGITTPLVTPFADGEIDWAAFDRLLEHVLDGGVDGVFPCGTTGEFASLTVAERRAVIERVVERAPPDVAVIAGGTGTDVPGARQWLSTLADLGVDAAVVTAPYFHPANDPDGLERFVDRVVDDSPLPILLYNIPSCVGQTLPVTVVERLAERPPVIGLKDSSGDLEYGLRLRTATPPDFRLLQGYDALLVAALHMGFDGGVNAGANVFPAAYAELCDDPGPARERAWQLHAEVIEPLFQHCRSDGFAPATKAGLAARDVINVPRVRPPLCPVDPEAVTGAVERAEAVV